MNRTRFGCMLLAGVLATSLVGCGEPKDAEPTKEPVETETVVESNDHMPSNEDAFGIVVESIPEG